MTGSDRRQFQQQLDDLHRSACRRLRIHGLVAWIALCGAVVLVLSVVFGLMDPPRWIAMGLLVSAVLLAVAAAVPLLVLCWWRLRSRTEFVRLLDHRGRFADTLGAVDEALRRPDRWREDTAVRATLVGRLFGRGLRLLADLEIQRLLPVSRPGLVFLTFVLVVVCGAALVWQAPRLPGHGWRQMQAAVRTAAPVSGGLRLAPGPTHVRAGDDLAIVAYDLVGGPAQLPVCEVREGTGLWRRVKARRVWQAADDPVLGAPFERWESVLPQVRDDLVVRFRRGDRLSAERAVEAWRVPLLTVLAATVEPPVYTGLEPMDLMRMPAFLEIPSGSRLTLRGVASRPLTAAHVVTAAGDTTRLQVRGDTLTGVLAPAATTDFRVHLRDQRGLTGLGELVHEVVVIPDRPPLVQLQRPDDDGRLPLSAPLYLKAYAEDDYGLVAVDLLVRRGDGGYAQVEGDETDGGDWDRVPLLNPDRTGRDGGFRAMTSLGDLPVEASRHDAPTVAAVRMDLSLVVADLALVPGDVLELALVARDNRQPPPPGTSRSAILRLQVPSSLEILASRDEVDEDNRADLEEMRRRTEALGADLQRLRRELLKDARLDWNRREELQAALDRQQALQEDLQRLAEALGDGLEELAENRLTSPELMQKMDEIANLLADTQDKSMAALLERLKESLDQLGAKELNRAMDELAQAQVDMLRRMDTAMAMLEDLAREQEMEGLTDLVAEMIARQQELADEGRRNAEAQDATADEDQEAGDRADDGQDADSQDADGQDDGDCNEELARRQEALAEELSSLEERLQEAMEKLQESGDDPSAAQKEMQEALSEALRRLEEQQTSQTMEQAGENLQQDQSEQAAQQMQQALTDLAGLYHVLLRSQVAMQMAMQAEQAGQMRDIASDLLALSQRQEDVGVDLPASLREVRTDDLARQQNQVLQGTITVRDGLEDVAAAAPQDIMRMLENIDKLIATQGRVLDEMREGRARRARQAAGSSLAAMNKLVINLLTQAQMTGQGGGSGQPQPSLSQQLGQMSGEQSGLNSLAEQMSRKKGRISQEFRAGMQRLQQGQQGLAGRARQLAEEQRAQHEHGGSRILGDLDALAADMERVGDDVAGGLVTEETMRRQERILSRLLDMHNAARERDWTRRRESRTADDVYADQTGERGPDPEQDTPGARRWQPIEIAPPAYRELVRDYFRQIQQLHELAGRDSEGRRRSRGTGEAP